MSSPTKNNGQHKIHKLEGYIQTIYMVENENGLFLLDGCCRSDVAVVKSFIEKELNKTIDDLKLVIATHAHPDHAGGLSFFKNEGIAIAGPKGLNEWYAGFLGFITYWVDILLSYLVAVNKKKGIKNILFPRMVELDYTLHDGDLIPGFECWKVLECPGHTNIDLTIYYPAEKLAYIADNFVGSQRKVFRPYPIYCPKMYKDSLQRYLDLELTNFLIAHYGQIKVPRKRIEELINSTPPRARRHMNTFPSILLKLVRSFLYKFLWIKK